MYFTYCNIQIYTCKLINLINQHSTQRNLRHNITQSEEDFHNKIKKKTISMDSDRNTIVLHSITQEQDWFCTPTFQNL